MRPPRQNALSQPARLLACPQLDSAALRDCLEGKAERPLVGLYVKDGQRGWAAAGGGSSGGGGSRGSLSCPTGGVRGLVEEYTKEGRHRRLADFEDHLEDITRCALGAKCLRHAQHGTVRALYVMGRWVRSQVCLRAGLQQMARQNRRLGRRILSCRACCAPQGLAKCRPPGLIGAGGSSAATGVCSNAMASCSRGKGHPCEAAEYLTIQACRAWERQPVRGAS